MKIEKLPSGSYRIRKMYKGKTYTVITDYKPTQKEAIQLMSEKLDEAELSGKPMTFADAYHRYVEINDHILSPSTIRGYDSMFRNITDHFKALRLSDITQADIQAELNRYSATHSAKSTRNLNGFISPILAEFRPNFVYRAKLPLRIVKEPYLPTSEDVSAILKYSEGTEYEVALMLAALGLRRSEICALTPDDLDGNILTISKSMVKGTDHKYVVKDIPKTSGSYRTVYLPDILVDKIRRNGKIYSKYPDSILRYLHKAQKDLGIEPFKLHVFRHYFVSYSHSMGIPEADILSMGGWSSDNVMKSVYRHAMKDSLQKSQELTANRILS
jgi:integrase